MTEEKTNDGVSGMNIGGLEIAGALKDLWGRERWRDGEDVIFGDL